MKVTSAYYLVGATNTSNFPPSNFPEIMLCGRSNVGKSTFLNTLFNMKKLAKISTKPGKTRVLNWFVINEAFNIVDVPGYGYAKVSKKERDQFGAMIEDYLTNRENLRLVILLLDYRHTPTQDDVTMYNYLKYHDIDVLFVLTKEDKIKRNDRKKNMEKIMERMDCFDKSKFIPFSSVSKINKNLVFDYIETSLK